MGAIVAILMIAGISGCATAPSLPPAPSIEAITPVEADRMTAEALTSYAQRINANFPDIELPIVDRERFIHPDEYAKVFAACMTEQGFDAQATDENTVSYGLIPDAQIDAQTIALYTCTAMYPTDPKYLRPMTSEQFTYLYAYSKTVLIPCLEDLDLDTPELPSEQAFIEGFGSPGGWFGYEYALDLPSDELQSVMTKCPQFPTNLWG